MFKHHYMLLASISTLSVGCANHAIYDVSSLRREAQGFYSDQIMDNLIQASNGLPFLHVNVSGLGTTVTGKATGKFDAGESVIGQSKRGINGTALIGEAFRQVTRPLLFSVGSEYTDALTAQTIPEFEDPESYKPYMQFLNLKSADQRLQSVQDFDLNVNGDMPAIRKRKSDEKLIEGQHYVYGTLRKWRGQYYYVPIAYKQAYFDLSMALIGRVKAGTKPVGAKDRTSGAGILPPKPGTSESQMLRNLNLKVEQLRSLLPQ